MSWEIPGVSLFCSSLCKKQGWFMDLRQVLEVWWSGTKEGARRSSGGEEIYVFYCPSAKQNKNS